MASIKFRFTTECEMTLHGESYEDVYLQFKDFMHGDQRVAQRAMLEVCPPESVQVFFNLDNGAESHEIPSFKGDYKQDIAGHCAPSELLMKTSGKAAKNHWGESWYPS